MLLLKTVWLVLLQKFPTSLAPCTKSTDTSIHNHLRSQDSIGGGRFRNPIFKQSDLSLRWVPTHSLKTVLHSICSGLGWLAVALQGLRGRFSPVLLRNLRDWIQDLRYSKQLHHGVMTPLPPAYMVALLLQSWDNRYEMFFISFFKNIFEHFTSCSSTQRLSEQK